MARMPRTRNPLPLVLAAILAVLLAAGVLVALRFRAEAAALLPLPDHDRREQADTMLGPWPGRADAVVFLDAGVSERERAAVRAKVAAAPGAGQVMYESKVAALVNYRRLFSDTPDALGASEDQLPESFRVRLADPAGYQAFEDALCDGPVRDDGRRHCLPGIDLVADETRLVRSILAGRGGDLGADAVVLLAPAATRWQRLRVQRRVEAVEGVAGVTYESPAAYEARVRTGAPDDRLLPRNRGLPSLRVSLADQGALAELRAAVCHGPHIGDCMAGALYVFAGSPPR
jgi:cell division protein FtsX